MAKQTPPAGMQQLRDLIDAKIRDSGSKWSIESVAAGLGRSTLHNVFHGRHSMRPKTAQAIARHFGFHETMVFELAGLQTPRYTGDPLADALHAVRQAPIDGATREATVRLLQAAAARDEAWRQRVREALAEVGDQVPFASLQEGADDVPAPHRLEVALERLRMRLLDSPP